MNVTDSSGNSAVYNRTLYVAPVRPDLKIVNVTLPSTAVEGENFEITLNVTNIGKINATDIRVVILSGDDELLNESVGSISVNDTRELTVSLKLTEIKEYQLEIRIYCSDEPTIYTDDNVMYKKVSVEQSPIKNYIVIGVVIAVIAALGAMYYFKKEHPAAYRSRDKQKKGQKKDKTEKKEKKNKSKKSGGSEE